LICSCSSIRWPVAVALSVSVLLSACGSKAVKNGPNPALARRLTEKGMQHHTSDADAAALFRKAIAANPFSPAAHNNLAVVLLRQGDYYAAAREFEEAIKLAPSNPQPRVNLGLMYEIVDQLRDAAEQYEQALIVSPQYLPAIEAMARARVRLGENDVRTISLLRTVVMRSSEQTWRNWAQRQLARLVPGEVPATQPASRGEAEPPDVLKDHFLMPAN
jgi:Flp pilus assembly protein TadD